MPLEEGRNRRWREHTKGLVRLVGDSGKQWQWG
jgi:hypothetical protein